MGGSSSEHATKRGVRLPLIAEHEQSTCAQERARQARTALAFSPPPFLGAIVCVQKQRCEGAYKTW